MEKKEAIFVFITVFMLALVFGIGSNLVHRASIQISPTTSQGYGR